MWKYLKCNSYCELYARRLWTRCLGPALLVAETKHGRQESTKDFTYVYSTFQKRNDNCRNRWLRDLIFPIAKMGNSNNSWFRFLAVNRYPGNTLQCARGSHIHLELFNKVSFILFWDFGNLTPFRTLKMTAYTRIKRCDRERFPVGNSSSLHIISTLNSMTCPKVCQDIFLVRETLNDFSELSYV